MGIFDSFTEKGKKFSDLQKYIGDFEIVEENHNGKLKKVARYKGTWTILKEVSSRTFCKLWAVLALGVGETALYVRTLLLTHLTSSRLTVMIPLLAGLFPLLYLMMGVLALPFRGKPMRRDQYMHSFIRASRSSVAIMVCVALALLATLIFRITGGDWQFFPEDLAYTGYSLAIAAVAAGIIFLLRSIDLTEKENGDVAKD